MLGVLDSEFISGMYWIKYSFRCILFTSFIFALFAGQFIAKDLKENISKSFIYGYKRSNVIVSKLIVFIIFSLFIELIYTTILAYYGRAYCPKLDIENVLYLIRIIVIGTIYNVATTSIVAMIAIITRNNLVTVVSPILFSLCSSVTNNKSCISIIVTYACPFIIGEGAMDRFASNSDIIIGIVSSVLTLIITIGGSLLYVKYEDFK